MTEPPICARLRAVQSDPIHGTDQCNNRYRNPDGPEAAAVIDALAAVATALVAKLDECAPHVADAFMHRRLRCGDYTGPTYERELVDLRAALAKLETSRGAD